MPKFETGDWVRPKGQQYRGLVCYAKGQKVLIRWAGRQKAMPWSKKDLVKSDPPRALVLEGSLDHDLASTRSEEDLLRTWLNSNDVAVAYKTIHDLGDIQILSRAIDNKWPVFLHISCHGAYENGRPYITLAPKQLKADRIFLDDPNTISIFKDNFSEIPVLFSACLLGKYKDPMTNFRKNTGLAAVAAFTREIYDSEAMLFELLLYQGMLVNGWTFKRSVSTASKALLKMGLRGGHGHSQSFVRVF